MTAVAALLIAIAPVAPAVADLSWLSGPWVERKPGGEWTEEYWTPPRAGMMIGAGLSGRAGTLRHFEHMRIAADDSGRIAFYAMPKGQAAVVFPLIRQTADEVVFENAAHDYPQRVSYRREGDRIFATISLIDGTRQSRWEYRRPD